MPSCDSLASGTWNSRLGMTTNGIAASGTKTMLPPSIQMMNRNVATNGMSIAALKVVDVRNSRI